MKKTLYRISRSEDGWAISAHGARLTFDTLERAISGATLAARTDQLCGKQAMIAVQQEDGSWETRPIPRTPQTSGRVDQQIGRSLT